ncbi:uncharacterized protein [Hyperolius riggenbachi]|uniref:uncharacterized protein n=1 Tax=Hyperolius riggenbachi TaxID=752182 RepID=UPI0035A28EDE
MDQSGGNNSRQSQPSNHPSNVNNQPPLGTGQPASILQVGGQSFLLVPARQQASPLQNLGLNLAPVNRPNAPTGQLSGPPPRIFHVRAISPGINQIGVDKVPPNQIGNLHLNVVRFSGFPPATIQHRPGGQPHTIQTNKCDTKPPQSTNPVSCTVQMGRPQSSLLQNNLMVPAQAAPLQFRAPKIKLLNTNQPTIIQTRPVMPPLSPIARFHHNVQVGKLPTSSFPIGSVIPTQTTQSRTFQFHDPRIKTVPEFKDPFPPASQHTGGLGPPMYFNTRDQLNNFPVGSAKPSQSGTLPMDITNIKTEEDLNDSEILEVKVPGLEEEVDSPYGFASHTTQSHLPRSSEGRTVMIQPLIPLESAKKLLLLKQSKQRKYRPPHQTPTRKNAFTSVVKLMPASTNTIKQSKSIGTQTKILLKGKSQAIPFPEVVRLDPEVLYTKYRHCYTQSQESYLPGPLVLEKNDDDPLPYKVVIVRDPQPEDVSLLWSSHAKDRGEWNMAEVEKWIPGFSEIPHPHFDDVAVFFTEEEWQSLSDKERKLYKKVMMDNYWNLVAVGKISVTPPVISKIERGEEPYVGCPQQTDRRQFSDPHNRDDSTSKTALEERYNIQSFFRRLKTITTPIRLAMAELTVTRIMSDPSTGDPSVPPHRQDRSADPGGQCPMKPYIKIKPVIPEKPFRCFKCDRTYKQFFSLVSHFRVHQCDNYLTCSECGKKCSKNKDLLLHYLKHTGERPFICSGCGRSFTSQTILNNHLGLNLKKKHFECSDCGKRFGVKQSLLNHEKLHSFDNPNICPVCGKVFMHKSGLRTHQKVHEKASVGPKHEQLLSEKEASTEGNEQMPLFPCSECGTAFLYESQLFEHQKIHQAG